MYSKSMDNVVGYTYRCTRCGHENDWGSRASRTDPACGQCDYPHSCVEEEWRQIPGFNYQVSSLGRVARTVEGKRRPLRPHINRHNGHKICVLWKSSSFTHNIRMLVAQSFLSAPKEGEQLMFVDGNKANCRADNLCWRSASDAILESYRAGTRKKPETYNVLSEGAYEEIKALWRTGRYSQVQIGTMYGISNSTVSKIVRGKIHPHARKYTPTVTGSASFNAAMEAEEPFQVGAKKGPLGQTRRLVEQILGDEPGITVAELAQRLGMSYHGAWHHVNRVKRSQSKVKESEV